MLKTIFINISDKYYSDFSITLNNFFNILKSNSIDYYIIHNNFENQLKQIISDCFFNYDECAIITPYDKSLKIADIMKIMTVGLIDGDLNQSLSTACFLIEDFENFDFNFLIKKFLHFHGLPATILVTERLIIRELTCENITQLNNIYNQPHAQKFMTDLCTLKEKTEKHNAYIKSMYHFFGYGLWGLFNKSDNNLMGQCGFENIYVNNEGIIGLGYILDSQYQKMGYAYEASSAIINYGFTSLDFQAISAIIEISNSSSIKTAQRLGMTCIKNINYKNRDCLMFSIKKEAFIRKSKRAEASKKAFEKFNEIPDKTVYSRIYPKV